MPELDPVTQRFEADVVPFVEAMGLIVAAAGEAAGAIDEEIAKIGELDAALASLHDVDIKVSVDSGGGAGLAAGFEAVKRDVSDISADLIQQTALLGGMNTALEAIQRDAADTSADLMMQTAILGEIRDLWEENALAADRYNVSIRAARAVTSRTGAAASAAAGGFRLWGTGIRLTGTALHWLVAGSAEFLAVGIPAAVAASVGAFVLYQGVVENVGRHLQALYTTTEAVGGAYNKTAGDVLGLGHAFQTAQDAANPSAYELLGAYLNIARSHMVDFASAGLQVAHTLDELSAHITIDMQGALGGQVQGLLANMVTDLTELGQVAGNFGHTLLNLASEMPGLAEVLLSLLDDFSRFLTVLTDPAWYNLGGHLITIVMALEEFYRWGGLALSVMVRLTGQMAAMNALGATNFITRFGAALITLVSAGGSALTWAGQMVGRLAGVSAAAGAVGTAMVETGGEIRAAALSMSLWGAAGIAGAIAGLAILAVALRHVHDAADNVASSAVKAANAAQGMAIFTTVANQLQKLQVQAQQTTTSLHQMSPAMQEFGTAADAAGNSMNPILSGLSGGLRLTGGFSAGIHAAGTEMQNTGQSGNLLTGIIMSLWGSFAGATGAAHDVNTLTAAQQKLIGMASTTAGDLAYLGSTFRTSAVGAAYLAQAAGVDLHTALTRGSEAAKTAAQQIRNLITGMGAMTAPAGAVGNDMTVLGIQSQLAGMKIQQLSQAWDQWISSVTGSMSAMSQVQTTLQGMSKDAAATSASTSGSINSIKLAAQGASYTLRGLGQNAMQSWQQFTQAVNTGNSALDQLRTGLAEHVVSWQQFGSTLRGLVGEMAPFTQGNRTAVLMLSQLAQEAGGPATSSLKELEHWAGVSGKTARGQFAAGMELASREMSSMSKVAQNLSAVLSGQLDQAMAADIVKSSGLSVAMAQYATDLANTHTPAATLNTDLQRISDAYSIANRMTAQSSQGLSQAAHAADLMSGSARQGTGVLHQLAGSESQAAGEAAAAAAHISGLNAQISGLHSKTVDVTVNTTYNSLQGYKSQAHFGGARQAGGDVAAGMAYTVGEAGRELFMPGVDGYMMPAHDTERFLSPPAPRGGGVAGGGSGPVRLEATVHNHVMLDGEQIWENQQRHTLIYGVRNGSPQQGTVAPGR